VSIAQPNPEGPQLTEEMLRPDYNFRARDFADPECPNCHGKGIYDRSIPGQPFDWRGCVCVEATRHLLSIEVVLRRAFSQQERAMTFHTWKTGGEPENRQALKVAMRFVQHWDVAVAESWILGFYGETNTGKTHLAIALAQALTQQYGISPYVVNVPELLERQRESFSSSEAESPLRTAQEAEFLVLDDLGAEYNRGSGEATTWVEDFLFKILEYRIRHNRPTVYTTNLGKAQITKALGMRIASRLQRKQVVPPQEIVGVEDVGEISPASSALLLG
jgi:DNA replication protein DnaC